MYSRRWAAGLVVALCVTATSVQAAGSWVANAVTPTLRERGIVYSVKSLRAAASTPVNGEGITTVAWRFDFHQPRPRGLRIDVCAGRRCIEARPPAGSSTFFAGLPPEIVFSVHFAVAGRGMIKQTLTPSPMQLAVNFE